jgi:Domain of unknown function (DUF6602)
VVSIVEIFDQVAEQMRSDLARARSALEHPGLKGSSFEEVFRTFLEEYLPKTLDISSGVVVDSEGRSTRQLDVIISDAAKTPIFYRSADTRVVPIEGVYAVIEVKANLDGQELERAFENMKSVRALKNTAYVQQTGAVIFTKTMYGQEWDGWPTNYFVFAFDSSPLNAITEKLEEKHAQEALPPWKRMDCICVLNKGVILNQVPGGMLDALPGPGTRLRYYETQRALLLFYALISRYMFQAEIPHFRFTDYLGQLRF